MVLDIPRWTKRLYRMPDVPFLASKGVSWSRWQPTHRARCLQQAAPQQPEICGTCCRQLRRFQRGLQVDGQSDGILGPSAYSRHSGMGGYAMYYQYLIGSESLNVNRAHTPPGCHGPALAAVESAAHARLLTASSGCPVGVRSACLCRLNGMRTRAPFHHRHAVPCRPSRLLVEQGGYLVDEGRQVVVFKSSDDRVTGPAHSLTVPLPTPVKFPCPSHEPPPFRRYIALVEQILAVQGEGTHTGHVQQRPSI